MKSYRLIESAAFAAASVGAATLLIHLFSPVPPGWRGAVVHMVLVCLCFATGFVVAQLAGDRLAARIGGAWSDAPLLRIWAPSLAALIIGAQLLSAVNSLTPAPLHFDHGEEDWGLKMGAVWLVMSAVMHQSDRARRLDFALRRLSERATPPLVEASEDSALQVEADGRTHSIRSGELVCIEAEENYCRLMLTTGRSILTRMTLASLEAALPPDVFVRTHRSHLINLARVASAERRGRGFMIVFGEGLPNLVRRHSQMRRGRFRSPSWSLANCLRLSRTYFPLGPGQHIPIDNYSTVFSIYSAVQTRWHSSGVVQ